MLSKYKDTDLLILFELDDKTLFHMSLTCKYMAELCRNEILWQKRLKRKFNVDWQRKKYGYTHPRKLYLQMNHLFYVIHLESHPDDFRVFKVERVINGVIQWENSDGAMSPYENSCLIGQNLIVPDEKWDGFLYNYYFFFPCARKVSYGVTTGANDRDDFIRFFGSENMEKYINQDKLIKITRGYIDRYYRTSGYEIYHPRYLEWFMKVGILEPDAEIDSHIRDSVYVFELY